MAFEPFEIHDEDQFANFLEIEQFELADHTLILVFRLLTSDVGDTPWDAVLKNVRRFLRYIKRTQRDYHFVFDTHRCPMMPLMRLHQFQQLTATKPDVLDACLRSNIVIVQNRAVDVLIRTALAAMPPRRPTDIIQCETCSGVHEHGLPESVWGEAQAFLDKYARHTATGGAA